MAVRTALVTGAGSGIGQAISISMAAAGHHVVATDISSSGLEKTLDLVSGSVESRILDVTSSSAVASVISDIGNTRGIDILVNCAGWDRLQPFLETDEDFWDQLIELNYKGVLRTTHNVLPLMVQNGWGRIINIGSDAGRVGSSMEAVYSGTKGAVVAFTKTIAREMARYGITANSVCPGPTQTALLDEITAASEDGDRVISSMTRGVPLRRLGTPEDVAAAVTFFASEQADYITGQTLSVSGGLTMA
jgi:2-hydroxycyclohexanecarboxyl-CoA dehydrogenase